MLPERLGGMLDDWLTGRLTVSTVAWLDEGCCRPCDYLEEEGAPKTGYPVTRNKETGLVRSQIQAAQMSFLRRVTGVCHL